MELLRLMIISRLEPIAEQTVQDGDDTIVIRSIDDLMRLSSYSDMSDVEIEKLTNFKVSQARAEAESDANARINAAFQSLLQEQTAAALQSAQAAYSQALQTAPALTVIEDSDYES